MPGSARVRPTEGPLEPPRRRSRRGQQDPIEGPIEPPKPKPPRLRRLVVRGRTLTRLWYEAAACRIAIAEIADAAQVDARTAHRWLDGTNRPASRIVRGRVAALIEARGGNSRDLFDLVEAPVADDVIEFTPLRPAPPPAVPRRAHRKKPKPAQETPPMEITSREYLDFENLAHFGLAVDPFVDSDQPDDLFMHPSLKRAEQALLAAILRRQIVAVVCDPGGGKSSLIRRVYSRTLRERKFKLIALASLDRRKVSPTAIAVAILRDLIGKDTSSMSMEARSELLRTTLEEHDKAGLFPALLIDEAHLLRAEALIAIKQVWDSHTMFHQLAVIMVGQSPLEARLRTDFSLRELTGRTQILRLAPLGAQTADYVRWRFARVQGDADAVFDESAMKALALRGEYPLWINNLAVLAMRLAHQVGDTRVTAAHIGKV